MSKNERTYIGEKYNEILALPNLVEVQTLSYDRFLSVSIEGEEKVSENLQDVFNSVFPIESPNGDLLIEYVDFSLDYQGVRFSEAECKRKGHTYAVPLKARINLVFQDTGEIRQKEIYMGDIPIMTERGTFVINGIERIVVSQLHRSPGVIFNNDKGVHSSRIIPYRGSWLDLEVDAKKEIVYTKIDRKKRILTTMFLRALGLNTREDIIEAFYKSKTVRLSQKSAKELPGFYLAKAVYIKDESGNERKLYRAGEKLMPHDIDDLRHSKVSSISIIDMLAPDSLNSVVILNCFEREAGLFAEDMENKKDEPSREDALSLVYSTLQPGDPVTVETADRELQSIFFSARRYDLGKVGRYKLNKKLETGAPGDLQVLTIRDIILTIKHLIKVYEGYESVDDIDHMGNRRVRSVGELMANQLKTAFSRMDRIVRERMPLKDTETLNPQDLISTKPIVSAIKDFFGSSQLSQFMEQVNPLAELTHKRRLNALGPGGLSRDRAGFEVRDVHYSHYGRMCPIETPEGPNIGLIVSLANYTRINEFGFLETPYRRVLKGKVSDRIEYLSAMDEEKCYIAQASAKLDPEGNFVDELVAVRRSGDYTNKTPEEIEYMDVSPRQIISTAASLIPFLEHDDANRALMGCNMQRQAVPLLFPEAPIVGTGMEAKAAYDAGVVVKARDAGEVTNVTSCEIRILHQGEKAGKENEVAYPLLQYGRTNQDTSFHQRPLVKKGDRVTKGELIADGPATDKGELALGRNLLVGFVPWNGYNFEDAVLISQKVVKDDYYTSIHIKEFSIQIRETKLGLDKITRDIPNIADKNLGHLDEEGIVRIGAHVKSGDVLVGRITPKSESDSTPEFRLLNSIFGEKARDVRDTSLKLPHGVEGTVVEIQRLARAAGDNLDPGVNEVVKVVLATKRKLKEGDKMAGRHGNKGVVARILPEEDMPFLEDGTPLEICLNPLGIPSRMNIGQILETMLGHVGQRLGRLYEASVFLSPDVEEISQLLEESGVSRASKMTAFDGQTGDAFENEILVGYMYYLKLHHLVDDKMHARSTGPYSLVTQQPLGGKAQFGGQRLGEMEVWALEAYGASHTLQELMTVKSDDMNGRVHVYESIVKGDPASTSGIPESFNVLVQELRGLALDVSVYDRKNKQLPLTERDDELINRQDTF
ncbi:DNA-directed RNA polymerase subunit beta [Candidatus Haliotispira prima]|uniref:DNA-directed RNA polymerase subunit beta n=1 Tax=Candidatus Haliotispira prima TaxID=3034016 RepID=A0ABY8MK94_9SPIO|nr:DNA-directed RNA polymerase subunit beta [Candidatus Haliotispira prima]